MPEVLPGIDDQNSTKELNGGNGDPVDELGQGELPRSKCRRGDKLAPSDNLLGQPGKAAAGKKTSQHWATFGQVFRKGGRVEANGPKHVWHRLLRKPDSLGPHGHVVVLLPEGRLRIEPCQSDSENGLDDVLENDIAEDLVARDVVPLDQLDRGMQAVLRKEVADVNEVEEHGDAPIGEDGQGKREVLVGEAGDDGRERLEGVIGQRGQPGGHRDVLHCRCGVVV